MAAEGLADGGVARPPLQLPPANAAAPLTPDASAFARAPQLEEVVARNSVAGEMIDGRSGADGSGSGAVLGSVCMDERSPHAHRPMVEPLGLVSPCAPASPHSHAAVPAAGTRAMPVNDLIDLQDDLVAGDIKHARGTGQASALEAPAAGQASGDAAVGSVHGTGDAAAVAPGSGHRIGGPPPGTYASGGQHQIEVTQSGGGKKGDGYRRTRSVSFDRVTEVRFEWTRGAHARARQCLRDVRVGVERSRVSIGRW